MGVDLMLKRKAGLQRAWTNGRDSLKQDHLFMGHPELRRLYKAEPFEGKTLQSGGEYLVQLDAQQVIVSFGNERVARVTDASPELCDAIIQHGHGVALGCVQQLYPLSGVAEISIS